MKMRGKSIASGSGVHRSPRSFSSWAPTILAASGYLGCWSAASGTVCDDRDAAWLATHVTGPLQYRATNAWIVGAHLTNSHAHSAARSWTIPPESMAISKPCLIE